MTLALYLRHADDRADLRCGGHDPRPASVAGRGRLAGDGERRREARRARAPRSRCGWPPRASPARTSTRRSRAPTCCSRPALPGTGPRRNDRHQRPDVAGGGLCAAGAQGRQRRHPAAVGRRNGRQRRRQHPARGVERQAAGDPADHHQAAGANVIETVDRIKATAAATHGVAAAPTSSSPSSPTAPRRSAPRVADVQYTLLITIALVLLVVLLFMRRLMPTIAAAVTVPLSICGTLAGMWFMGYIARQFLADGADHLGRLRRRRCDRDDREHRPPSRTRHAIRWGGTDRLAADRLHRDVDQHLAGRGVHPADVHGRHHRTVVPRIRHDADDGDRRLGGGVADADADDLRPVHARRTSHAAEGRSGAASTAGVERGFT